jgi:hypothetical protein
MIIPIGHPGIGLVGLAIPLVKLLTPKAGMVVLKFIAKLCPAGLRWGIQNSNDSTPISSVLSCLPIFDTALLVILKTDKIPLTLFEVTGSCTSSFLRNTINP